MADNTLVVRILPKTKCTKYDFIKFISLQSKIIKVFNLIKEIDFKTRSGTQTIESSTRQRTTKLISKILFKSMTNKYLCILQWSLLLFSVEEQKIYYTFSSSTFLLSPMIVLLLASCLIVKELQNKKIKKSDKRKAIG